MEKMVMLNKVGYTYDAERKGAHYTFNGEKWLNAGELKEALLKAALGFTAEKDANTSFDAGSDIETLHMSVKSSKATLTNEILGRDFDTSMETYFARTASTCWAWVTLIDECVVAYVMNADKFMAFTKEWAAYNKEGKIRYKAESIKMLAWLEARA